MGHSTRCNDGIQGKAAHCMRRPNFLCADLLLPTTLNGPLKGPEHNMPEIGQEQRSLASSVHVEKPSWHSS